MNHTISIVSRHLGKEMDGTFEQGTVQREHGKRSLVMNHTISIVSRYLGKEMDGTFEQGTVQREHGKISVVTKNTITIVSEKGMENLEWKLSKRGSGKAT